MRVVRTITYDGSPTAIKHQLSHSLKDGEYKLATLIKVQSVLHIEEDEKPEYNALGRSDGWWTSEDGPRSKPTPVQKETR